MKLLVLNALQTRTIPVRLSFLMTSIFQLTFEANLLLGKLYYYEGSYQSALNVFENAHLENVSMATCSARLVHIIAESYAVKGKRSP